MKAIKWWKKLSSTLRGRLTLWYLSSVCLIIVVFLVATSLLFWTTLKQQIDHHIHIVVNEAAQIVQNYSGNQRVELLTNLVSAKGMTIVLLSPDGSPILETNSPDIAFVTEHELQGILSSSSLYGSAPAHFTLGSIRFAAAPVSISAGKGILAVGYSTQVLTDTFLKMIGMVASILLFLVLPLAAFGHQLLKHQLKPLEQIAEQAQAINTSNTLSKRMNIPATTKELAAITSALNKMISRLETIFNDEHKFFSDAAHALKTPLAILQSQIEVSSLPKKTKTQLQATIDQATQTTSELLFLAKIGINSDRQISKFSVSKLLTNLAELTATMAEPNQIEVSAKIQPKVEIVANRDLFQKALSNILHNAVIYNRRQGKIKITLRQHRKNIKIEIVDTGQGIAKSDQARIFDRFYRGSDQTLAGTGLGLAITHAVIQNLEGSIKFESNHNQGSRFIIYLPVKK